MRLTTNDKRTLRRMLADACSWQAHSNASHIDAGKISEQYEHTLAKIVPRGPVGKPSRKGSAVRQTSCRHCRLDIENFSPYRKGEWRDRGGNTHCNNGKNLHAPYLENRPHHTKACNEANDASPKEVCICRGGRNR